MKVEDLVAPEIKSKINNIRSEYNQKVKKNNVTNNSRILADYSLIFIFFIYIHKSRLSYDLIRQMYLKETYQQASNTIIIGGETF